MPGAFDRVFLRVHLTLVQECVRMRANVPHRTKLSVAEIGHGDLAAVHREPTGLALRDILRPRDRDEHHVQSEPSSSDSIARSRLCRTSVSVTRSRTSWKKPVTMSRSASSAGMPRDCM